MLRNLKISTKIIGTVVCVSLIGLGLSGFAAVQMNRIDTGYSSLVETRDVGITNLVRAARNVSDAAYSSYKAYAYDGASDAAKQAAADRQDMMQKGAELLQAAAVAFPAHADGFTKLKDEFQKIDAMTAEAVSIGLRNDDENAKLRLAQADIVIQQFKTEYMTTRDGLLKDIKDESNELSATTQSIILMTMIGSLLGLLLGIIGALFISAKGITGPLSLLALRMKELASGRLDVPIEGQDRRDEVGAMALAVQVFKDAANQNKQLEAEAVEARTAQAASRDRQAAIDGAKAEDLRVFVHAVEAGFGRLSAGDLTVRMVEAVAPEFEPIRHKFNGSLEALEGTIGSVVTAVGSMRTGLNEITIAAGDLSQRTEQQAASLEETVAALSEVTRGVNQTASNAGEAQGAAAIAQANAEKGGMIVSKAVEAMHEIERSSNEIGKIIGVIDEIAFQTNLLALNAGVEAARAGEAGRGFAVVAQEVRGLAQRSAEAAKEIKGLIHTSSQQVEQGVALVSQSGTSLNEIVDQVGDVAKVIAAIASSAREQAVSLKEVSTAADQMDKVTQQNAAMVEETTAAAQTLSAETEDLARLTERFQVKGLGGTKSPAAATARRSALSASRPTVTQMRHVGAGGAASKSAVSQDSWEEF